MTNLDLGGTIWLNVSRKLLSYQKYFFVSFKDMPKEVFEEFKRHKHTHPDVTLKANHRSHTHANATVTSSTTSHLHQGATTLTYCGNPDHDYSHRHTLYYESADSHSHSVTLAFGAANLGSPNWWEHVHPITIVSMVSGGASHTHSYTVNTAPDGCFYGSCRSPVANRHYHETSQTVGSAGGAHTHTLSPVNTGNANSAQTPESHQHSFSVTFDEGNSHEHSLTGSVSAQVCYYGYSHTHDLATTGLATHTHTASGNSGLGGEALPVVAKRPLWECKTRGGLIFLRLHFMPTLQLGIDSPLPPSPPPLWDSWNYLWVAVL